MTVAVTGAGGSAAGPALRLVASVAAALSLTALLPGSALTAPAAEDVCLIAPRAESGPDGRARAQVPIGRPTVFAVGELESIALERGGRLMWQRSASREGPIRGPIAWPVAPIRPGESVVLRLRPPHAPPGDFAVIELVGAPAAVMERGEALLRSLGNDPVGWQRAFEQELLRGDLSMAWALLFAHEGPSSPELDALRLEVYRRGCGSETPTTKPPPVSATVIPGPYPS